MLCSEEECFRQASFGPSGPLGVLLERCEIHRHESDVNHVDIVCELNKCYNNPFYGDGVRRYRCGLHRKYTDVKMGRFMGGVFYCTVLGCPYIRKYGVNGDLQRCERHRLKGDSIRTKPRCVVEGCKNEDVLYKKAGEKTNTHCYQHKEYGYVSSKSILCIEGDCFTSARFGNANDGVKRHCHQHREIDEINLSVKFCCEELGCFREKEFGSPGKKPMRCEAHSRNGDVQSVFTITCDHKLCLSQPSFGPPGGVVSTCSKHKLLGYVNLKTETCSNIFCENIPTFGTRSGPIIHCYKHAGEGEVNLLKRRCSSKGCETQPTFGPAKWKRRRCIKHKKKTDIYAVGKKMYSKYVPEEPEPDVTLEDSLFFDNVDKIFENVDEIDDLDVLGSTQELDILENIDKVFDNLYEVNMSEILRYEFSSLATLNTDSVGTFDTTVAAGTSQVTDVGATEAYGNTAHFDGSTNYVMSTVPTTLTDNSSRSCSVWIYSTVASGGGQRILSTGTGSGITIFQKRNDNKIGVQNSSFGTVGSTVIPLNTWTHVAFTYNGSGTVKVYMNGSLDGAVNWAMNVSTQDMKYVGGSGTTTGFFNGNMLDFRLYDSELDSTAMGTLYTNGPDNVGVLLTEPILWYKLNEDSAEIGLDSSVNSTNITNVGVVSTTDATYGQVSDFSAGTLTLPSASVPSAIIGSSSRTYSFWVESNVVSNTQIIDIGTRVSGIGTDWGTAINGSAKIGQTLFNTAGIQSSTVMTAGVWYYVVITFEDVGNVLSIYIDGVLETQASKTVNTGSTDLEFGEGGTQDMRLLDMRIYDVALDATEISTLYAAGPELSAPNSLETPILWYKFSEDSANIGLDSSGSLLNMTNSGVTTVVDSTYGNVASFDGSSHLLLSNVNVPAAMQGTSARSYSWWIKDTGSVDNAVLHSIGNESALGRRFRTQFTATKQINTAFFNTPSEVTTTGLTLNTWHNVVVLFTGSNYISYIDGSLENDVSKAVNTNATTDFGISIDPTLENPLKFTGYMVDFRVYDFAITQSNVTELFSTGPEFVPGSTGLDAVVYTHLTDLTWDTISGASEYTIKQIKDGSDEEDVIKTTELLATVNIDNSSTYVFNLYSDLDLITASATVNVTPVVISTIDIGNLLTRISNDLSILDDSAIVEIEDLIQDSLSTGDEVILPDGDSSIFVENSDTHVLGSGELNILTPFTTASAGTITITHPGETSSTVYVYDETTNEVNGSAIGTRFVSGNYVARLKEISD